MSKLRLKIDDHQIETDEAKTILEAAISADIPIPTLCYHPALEPFGACRLCSVEIEKKGRRKIVTACNYPVEDGLVVRTCSPEVLDIRKMIIELLLARCPGEERIKRLAQEYSVDEPRFKLDGDSCILCGLCTRVCEELVGVSAINAISRGVSREVDTPYRDLSEDCVACGSCALICPTNAIKGMMNVFPTTPGDTREIEEQFLSGVRDDDLGIYTDLFAGKSFLPGQDGGMVTSLLEAGIEKGLIDAAIVILQEKSCRAQAAIVDSIKEVRASRGTKYERISVISQLREALQEGKKRIAIVGTPCQIRVIRKLQWTGYLEEFPEAEIILLGLFCFESFNPNDLKDHIKDKLGVDICEADRIQIAKGKYTVTLDGKDYSCGVKELGDDVREGCQSCSDFVSRLADLSVGSVGSPEGYSTVIVRSDRGSRLLEAASYREAEASREDIVKLARLKRKNAEKHFAKIAQGLPVQG